MAAPVSRLIDRLRKKRKFKVRERNRCTLCGRPRAFIRKFELCRLCFRHSRCAARSPASSSRAGKGNDR